MQGKVEIAGVNTAKLKVLKNEETMELLRRQKFVQSVTPSSVCSMSVSVISDSGSVWLSFHASQASRFGSMVIDTAPASSVSVLTDTKPLYCTTMSR